MSRKKQKENLAKDGDEAVTEALTEATVQEMDEVVKQDAYAHLGEALDKLIKKGGKNVSVEDIPVIQFVDRLLKLGYESKASDIHIEPFEEYTLIRFRIDGILHDIFKFPPNLHSLITTRLKILSRLRTDEHSAAQDGKLRFDVGEGDSQEHVDVRVSIVPANFGEKTVMRLLSEQSTQLGLKNLGFSPSDLEIVERNASRPWGMILSTGPTGSGKTTSLYAILKILNKREVNISTIEDPVEYAVNGISQIQVNTRTGLTFANGLRALVRQDPDIIMVGEIRDEETASVAINSAMTGHLVLSTLHTNDSATAVPRLIDMGAQPFLVASTVNVIIGQRLVRRLCDECKKKSTITPVAWEAAQEHLAAALLKKFNITGSTSVYEAVGCKECDDGYRGRTVIAEVLEMSEEIKEMVVLKKTADEIELKAQEQGMITMIEDGLTKVLEGTTTIEELLRVAQM